MKKEKETGDQRQEQETWSEADVKYDRRIDKMIDRMKFGIFMSICLAIGYGLGSEMIERLMPSYDMQDHGGALEETGNPESRSDGTGQTPTPTPILTEDYQL